MNPKLSKFKALFIGFVLTKVAVTVLYVAGTWTPDFFPAQRTAEAQDVVLAQEAAAGLTEQTVEGEGLRTAEREEQYADISALMTQLETKRLQLKDEEARIKQERAQLEQLKRDLDLKLDELAAVQAQIDASLARQEEMVAQAQKVENEAEAAKLNQLVKVYTSMTPKKAAEIIEKLDMKVVYDVFSIMKGDQVGQILSYVSGDRAAEITERLASSSVE